MGVEWQRKLATIQVFGVAESRDSKNAPSAPALILRVKFITEGYSRNSHNRRIVLRYSACNAGSLPSEVFVTGANARWQALSQKDLAPVTMARVMSGSCDLVARVEAALRSLGVTPVKEEPVKAFCTEICVLRYTKKHFPNGT